MKTSVGFFDETVQTATIVVKKQHEASYRGMLTALGVTITKENENTQDDIVIFKVANLKTSDIHLFDKNDGNECYIHHYILTKGKFRVEFYTTDTSRQQKNIETIYIIAQTSAPEGKKKTSSIATIFEKRDFDTPYPLGYTINWGAWGSVDIETANLFSEGLKMAATLAEDCTKQFVK